MQQPTGSSCGTFEMHWGFRLRSHPRASGLAIEVSGLRSGAPHVLTQTLGLEAQSEALLASCFLLLPFSPASCAKGLVHTRRLRFQSQTLCLVGAAYFRWATIFKTLSETCFWYFYICCYALGCGCSLLPAPTPVPGSLNSLLRGKSGDSRKQRKMEYCPGFQNSKSLTF